VEGILRAVIFANGELGDRETARLAIQPGDLLIAADGGGAHCLALGLVPDLLVGDLDSLASEIIARFEADGVEILQYPARKDHTDLELALLIAQERGAQEVLILAALGKRWDQTLANILLPAERIFASLRIRLLDGNQEIGLLRAGEQLILSGNPGDTLSLIPLIGDACGITTQGLEYPLFDENLLFGATRGISNVLLESDASISLRSGLLVVVVIHHSWEADE
jgi:thiamine pyrophosphokinase